MDGYQLVESDCAIKLAKQFSRRRFAADVITGRKNVRGVEANAQTFRLAHVSQDVGDLLKGVAKTGSLARSRFQGNACLHFWDDGKHLIDRADNRVQPGFLSRSEMRSRMHDQEWEPQ